MVSKTGTFDSRQNLEKNLEKHHFVCSASRACPEGCRPFIALWQGYATSLSTSITSEHVNVYPLRHTLVTLNLTDSVSSDCPMCVYCQPFLSVEGTHAQP